MLLYKKSRLDQTAQTEVFLDDDIWIFCQYDLPKFKLQDMVNLPLTAAMTNRICVVSVAQVK